MTRPARFRLMSKAGVPHGTYKRREDACEEAKRLELGEPNMSDDEPNGWYLETTVARKLHKRPRRDIQVAGAK